MKQKSPDYTDILPISPSKVRQRPRKLYMEKFTDIKVMNGAVLSGDSNPKSLHSPQDEMVVKMDSLRLDVNDNQDPELANCHLSKSSTLPRRHSAKTPPPKPPRLPPKPPRLMEKKLFICENPECRKEEELLGIVELNFKSCSSCFTHYCSPECRRSHWHEHKRACYYGRIHSHMKSAIHLCRRDEELNRYLTDIARNGYMSKGRGSVMLIFLSPSAAEIFVETQGIDYFEHPRNEPTYSSIGEIRSAGVMSKYQKNLLELVTDYFPTRELVVTIAVVVGKNLPTTPVPRSKEPAVIENLKLTVHESCYAKELSRSQNEDLYPTRTPTRRKSM